MQCPQCQFDCPPEFSFCPKCGAALQQACAQCGFQVPPDFAFCPKCGTPLAAAAPPPPPPQPTVAPDLTAERLQRLVPQEYAERLMAMQGQVERERRMVTILFSDVKGSTAMAETMDPEDVMEIMEGAFEVLIAPIYKHEGTLARLMGDAILAFFGAPISHEDDPERAIHAALDIVSGASSYAARLEKELGLSGFSVRVGINTGLVVVGEVGSDLRVEYTAMGDAINLAARMEQSAPVGGILISHDTYRHVRGVFDVQPQEPLWVKGKSEPVQTYVVERARPRAFRKGMRGVEGIETRMIGREAELMRLQDAFYTAIEDGERQMATIVGEAGVGKSRLLYEFDIWADLLPDSFAYLTGRASQEMQNLPYALLRDLMAFRFGIRERDPLEVAQQKLERGMAEGLGAAALAARAPLQEPLSDSQMKAHIVGQLLGFDFGHSPHVQAVGDDAQQLRDRAVLYLGDYFKALAVREPVLILLEDIHWADDSSLDVVNQLAQMLSDQPLFVVCTARPVLFERRPHWGEGQLFHARLDLRPLSKRDSRRLVEEILQKANQVPPALRDLVVGGAEGNPFYVEELIKMLIEEGVIVKSKDEEGPWQVIAERLAEMQVPPTLTGVLQARLDSLPSDERAVLQQASVVGRLFWDMAVARIATDAQAESEAEQIRATLSTLREREMVFRRETSAFEGTAEYIFKHATVRDVTYEGVLKRVRRAYHGLVAEWLMEQSGKALGEYSGLVADHLDLAGRREESAVFLRRAGEHAAAQYANAEAVTYFSRALDLTPETDTAARYELLLAREKVHDLQGAREPQARDLEDLEQLAETLGDRHRQAEVALRWAHYSCEISSFSQAISSAKVAIDLTQSTQDLGQRAQGYLEWGSALWRQGDYDAARPQLEQALALAQESGERRVEALSLRSLGNVLYVQGELAGAKDCYEESLHICREIGDRRSESGALNNLGAISVFQGDQAEARAYYEQALHINREMGDRSGETFPLVNLSLVSWALDDYAAAQAHSERSLQICREIGDRRGEAVSLGNLGTTARDQGDFDSARDFYEQSLHIHREIGDRVHEGSILSNLATVYLHLGDERGASAHLEQSLALCRELEYRWGETLALLLQGWLVHSQGDDGAAQEYGVQVLHAARETGNHMVEALALTLLGLALEGLEQWAEAAEAYRDAQTQMRAMGWLNRPVEPLAGLARLSMVQGDLSQAEAHVDSILDCLESHTVHGTWEPFRVYLTCYQVLKASQDPRATDILTRANTLLMERAVKIGDEGLRRTFLENVAANRELAEEMARAGTETGASGTNTLSGQTGA